MPGWRLRHRLILALVGALIFTPAITSLGAAATLKLRDIVVALTKASEQQPIDLSGQDLSDLDLSNLNFKAARLDDANLFGSNLSSSDLRNVHLKGVTLDRARLTKTNFTRANLRGSRILIPAIHVALESWIWDAPTFRQSDLSGAQLSGNFDGTDFGAANMRGVRFGIRSSLERCEFSGSNLIDASFKRARLRYARFVRADLRGADFHDAKLIWVDFTGADLRGANFTGADISMSIFDDANLEGTDLTSTTGHKSARGLSAPRASGQ